MVDPSTALDICYPPMRRTDRLAYKRNTGLAGHRLDDLMITISVDSTGAVTRRVSAGILCSHIAVGHSQSILSLCSDAPQDWGI